MITEILQVCKFIVDINVIISPLCGYDQFGQGSPTFLKRATSRVLSNTMNYLFDANLLSNIQKRIE